MKTCVMCGRMLDESMFNKNTSAKDGLQAYCKECRHKKYMEDKSKNNIFAGNTNSELSKFTPRQLIEELKARGYTGVLKYTYEINL